MLSEIEELEYLRMKKRKAGIEEPRKTPKQMYGSYGFTGPAPKKGEYVSASDDPSNGGLFRALESIDKGIYDAGGKVTDVASGMGASPEVAGGAGYLANVTLQTLPMLFGGSAGKTATVPLQNVGRDLMQSAVKPTLKQLKSGDAAVAIDTMLKEGISPNKAGVEKLQSKIGDLNDQIRNVIANSPATVKKSDVGKRLIATLNQARNQVNPQADMEAVRKAWLEFRNHPLLRGKTDIPVQQAQELKQGTYKQLSKKYGQMGSAEVEAQKGLARGLKEEIAAKVPEIAGLNAEETKLIKTLNVAERRALMELNKNPAGLALLTHNPASFAAFVADKSSAFKALAARLVYSSAETAGPTAGRTGVALSELASGMNSGRDKQ